MTFCSELKSGPFASKLDNGNKKLLLRGSENEGNDVEVVKGEARGGTGKGVWASCVVWVVLCEKKPILRLECQSSVFPRAKAFPQFKS